GQLKFIDDDTPVADDSMTNEEKLESLYMLFGEDSKELSPNLPFTYSIDIRIVNGHTAHMMLPQIKYNGQTVVFMADLLPSAGHIPIPYVMAYDMYPLTTLKEKKSFFKDAIENDYILFFEHDPLYECCTLQQTEKGIRPKEFFKLEEV
ncbi:MAG TPA: hypothetical protein VFH08_11555, partial [Chitinophagaceae bacterium]|nr:hypothetical protein [Chitinophagaceae bacterium]